MKGQTLQYSLRRNDPPAPSRNVMHWRFHVVPVFCLVKTAERRGRIATVSATAFGWSGYPKLGGQGSARANANASYHTRSMDRPCEATATVEIVPSPSSCTVHNLSWVQTLVYKKGRIIVNGVFAICTFTKLPHSSLDRLAEGGPLRIEHIFEADQNSTRRTGCRGPKQ